MAAPPVLDASTMEPRRVLPFAALLLVLGGLAGCLDGPGPQATAAGAKKIGAGNEKVWTANDPLLSQPVFDQFVYEPFPLTASDGTRLDNWVYRPVTPEGVKVPTIVHLSPYFGTSLPRGGASLERILHQNLTARGYAVMAASVRGTGFSEGCFEIGGPRERQDYNELFNEIAKQPWSNGNIGLIGVSYDGTAPQGALIASSPHLKTIVPIAAISEWYKYNFIKGVQINPQGWAFNTYYVADEGTPNLHGLPHMGPLSFGIPTGPPTVEDVQMWPDDAQVAASRLCPNQGSSNGMTRGTALVDTQRAQFATAATGTTDPYWEERNFTRFLDKVRDNVSVLIVHGLIDYNVKTHNLMPWIPELQRHNVATKILLGQWGHAYPSGPGNYNGPGDWNLTLLRWFDHWLKGIDTGIMDEPRAQIQDYFGVWRQEDNFPPGRVQHTRFYLAPNRLVAEPGSGTATFTDNGQAFNGLVPVPGNAVAFIGPKLDKEFRYSGEAVAHLELSHDMPRGHVAVTVYNVTGDNWRPVNWGYHNYNIRNDPAKYDPLLPGTRFTLAVPLLPTDMVIPKGSQVAVVFAGQSAGGPGMLPPPSGGTSTLHLGEKSYVSFPVLDGIEPMSPQPRNILGKAANRSSAGN